MEETRKLQELLEQTAASSRRQEKYAKLQCIFTALAALCCAGLLVTALLLLPKVNQTFRQVDTVLTNVEQVSRQLADADLEGAVENLSKVSEQMAQADLGGLAEDVTELVRTSQMGVEDALGKLSAIDLETLNKAIKDLSAIVAPLAKLAGRF